MERKGDAKLGELARVFEVTSDAVALCDKDGTILHVNRQMLELVSATRSALIGTDIKDLLYNAFFERSASHGLPFPINGSDSSRMLKLHDGSFIPVNVRALSLGRMRSLFGSSRVVVAVRSLEERYASDRKTQRLLSELQAANKRLSGTLSIIMSTMGSNDLATLLDTVLNRIAETLDAAGTSIYFAESGGFKLRGMSRGLEGLFVPRFIPYGAGVPTHVLREQRACRLTIVPGYGTGDGAASYFDMDSRARRSLRMQDTPPFKTMIAVPVYYGTQVLAVIELGWIRPCTPRAYDVRVLEVVCDYLSIELVGLVSSVRSARVAELTRSLNRVREQLFQADGESGRAFQAIVEEVRDVLGCRALPVLFDERESAYVIDFEGGNRVWLPSGTEEMFFSTTAPAARVGVFGREDGLRGDASALAVEEGLKFIRLARIERISRAGRWLEGRGLPCQGAVMEFGSPEEGFEPPAEMPRCIMLLRDSSQEPIDDLEYDYLTHLAHDMELVLRGVRQHRSERRIAQTLQAGMRSSLGSVPGIVSDSLYSSATSQALVGGDFYTLIRLPDDCAVMILGDVSGKGVEAASMSALVKTALTAYAWEGARPARMARSLNRMLMSFSRVETFVTTFIAHIDLRAGRVRYCSAGHPPSMLIRRTHGGGMEAEQLGVQSGVVGAFESMTYTEGEFSFGAGDILFMYTDGAIEARDSGGEFFGERRLRETLLSAAGDGVEGLCGKVLASLDEFTDSSLDDDIALVALCFESAGQMPSSGR